MEEDLISCVVDEKVYQRVSFLRPEDFKGNARLMWTIIEKHQGNYKEVIREANRLNIYHLFSRMSVPMLRNIKEVAVLILEKRLGYVYLKALERIAEKHYCRHQAMAAWEKVSTDPMAYIGSLEGYFKAIGLQKEELTIIEKTEKYARERLIHRELR